MACPSGLILRRALMPGAAASVIAACSAQQLAAVEQIVLTGPEAAAAWGSALGIAEQVAELAVPGLAPLLALANTLLPPLLAAIQAGSASDSDVAFVAAMAAKVIAASSGAYTVTSNA